jgi:hypothetical protein
MPQASRTCIPFAGDFSSTGSAKNRNCERKSFAERTAWGAKQLQAHTRFLVGAFLSLELLPFLYCRPPLNWIQTIPQ